MSFCGLACLSVALLGFVWLSVAWFILHRLYEREKTPLCQMLHQMLQERLVRLGSSVFNWLSANLPFVDSLLETSG